MSHLIPHALICKALPLDRMHDVYIDFPMPAFLVFMYSFTILYGHDADISGVIICHAKQ
jgi:hypothetical protein